MRFWSAPTCRRSGRDSLWLIDDVHGQIVLAATPGERDLLRDAAATLLAGHRIGTHGTHAGERAERYRAGGGGGSESVVAKVVASFIAEDVAMAGERRQPAVLCGLRNRRTCGRDRRAADF
jgi:hypothetical protein